MGTAGLFNVLDSTDSTNNYAMAQAHAGMAKHGMAWFAHEQIAGKGQQGRSWESIAGQNIALSIAVKPPTVFFQKQFYFNAIIANTCHHFFKDYAGDEIFIKWPNDIYWRDRKAGGILIENKLMGREWKLAIVGIGMNINQSLFTRKLSNPVSLKQITGREHDPLKLAKKLYELIMIEIDGISEKKLAPALKLYNENLYKKGSIIPLKKKNVVFETRIKEVNEYGQLITEDSLERIFNHGEVEFQVPSS